MLKITKCLFFFSLLTTLSIGLSVQAQVPRSEPFLTLEAPQYSGTGCPDATLSSALSPEGSSLSLLPDSFVVEADAGSNVARKNCIVEIPLIIPNGMQLSIIGIDYRGFNDLPQDARAEFSVSYEIGSGQAIQFNTTFNGPLLEDFFLRSSLSSSNRYWSSCGGNVTLRSDKSLVVTSNANGDLSSTSIDSIDLMTQGVNRTAATNFYFDWRACTPSPTTTTSSNTPTTQPSSGAPIQRPNLLVVVGLVTTFVLLGSA